MKEENKGEDFIVECNVCHQQLNNWVGSTPCCGSIAYLVNKDGSLSNSYILFGSMNGGDISPLKIKTK